MEKVERFFIAKELKAHELSFNEIDYLIKLFNDDPTQNEITYESINHRWYKVRRDGMSIYIDPEYVDDRYALFSVLENRNTYVRIYDNSWEEIEKEKLF